MGAASPINARITDAPGKLRNVLALHLCATVLRGAVTALPLILPFHARNHFNASGTEVLLLSASMNVMQFFTIFWNRIFQNVSTAKYLCLVGLIIATPLLAMGFATTLTPIIVCWILAAFGGAGGGVAFSPISADILRNRYPEGVRGRVFGLISAAQFLGVAVAGYWMGRWLKVDPMAYRYFAPMVGTGFILCLFLLTFVAPMRPNPPRAVFSLALLRRSFVEPIVDLKRLLREDQAFKNYEVAYMSYGTGWMITSVLLPLIAVDRLGLDPREFSRSTIVFFQATMMLMLLPGGWMADKLGPVRLAGISFAWLMIYPVLLIFAESETALATATILYAMGMVGVHLTWTLGPVAFAPDPSQASRYLAVHGTLVGVRAILFQGLAIVLYRLTGGFVVPLIVAAFGFVYASWKMGRLRRDMRRQELMAIPVPAK